MDVGVGVGVDVSVGVGIGFGVRGGDDEFDVKFKKSTKKTEIQQREGTDQPPSQPTYSAG